MWIDLLPVILIVVVGAAMLVTWWYSVAVLQPRVKSKRKAIFLEYVHSRDGKEIPLPDLEKLTIFDFGTKKFHDLNQQTVESSPMLGHQQLYCDTQAAIRLNSHETRVAFGSAGETAETSTQVIFWQVTLLGEVKGWTRLRSATSKFKGAIRAIDIESVDVNKAVRIHAHPKKLAYSAFAPDVIAWYLETSHRPWVYVAEDKLIVVAETYPQPGIFEKLEQEVVYLMKAVERSGALEKKA